MDEIKKQIKILLAIKNDSDFLNDILAWDKQDKQFELLTELARKENTLLGRIVKFPVADGYALT
jgi:hypothetical protein